MRGKPFQLAAAVAALTGCPDAKVNAFTASSGHICAGDHVELAWNITGSGSMKITPPVTGAPDGPVEDVGSASIAPTQPTDVELHVTRFLASPTTSVQRIRMERPEALTASLGDADASPGCADGKVFATVHAKRFASDIRVTTVTSRAKDDRSYEVHHLGAQAKLEAGAVVTPFRGLPIQGDWSLSTTLRPGETCQTTTLANLGVEVFTECAAGAKP